MKMCKAFAFIGSCLLFSGCVVMNDLGIEDPNMSPQDKARKEFARDQDIKWTKIAHDHYGDHFLNTERIRKYDGYVYFWSMGQDKPELPYYIEPYRRFQSMVSYRKGDCASLEYTNLVYYYFEHKDGQGDREESSTDYYWDGPDDKDAELSQGVFEEPIPGSAPEKVLIAACKHVGAL